MKNIFKHLLIILCALSATSCEEAFNYDADSRIDYDEIFSLSQLTGWYLNNCYSKVNYYNRYSMGNTFAAAFTDEAHTDTYTRARDYYAGETSSSNELVMPGHYESLYEGIGYCNIFLANIDDVPEFSVDAYASRWKGEAYIIRAYIQLQLLKRYGPMPILKEELPRDFDYSTITRPTYAECVNAIVEDCELGLAEPEVLWRPDSSAETGTFTRAVALAIISESMLYAASPQWNDGTITWADAAAATKESLDALLAEGYELYDVPEADFAWPGCYNAYQDYFFQPVGIGKGTENKEGLLVGKSRMTNVWNNYGLPFCKTDGVTNSGISPSQELVDAYETIDGQPVLDLESPYLDADHLQPNYNTENTLYDPADPYANRDPRMRSSIYCNGDMFNLSEKSGQVEAYIGGNAQVDTSDNLYTLTGYYLRKFINWNSDSDAGYDGYWSVFRLAEMYLNYAEAELEANGPTEAAYAAVNAVRSRAGMPNLPEGLTTDQFRLRVRNERRVELAFEEHRFFDLRRWGLHKENEGVVTGMNITKVSDDEFTYTRFVASTRNVVDDKYLLLPVSKTEEHKFSVYGVDIQNPGW